MITIYTLGALRIQIAPFNVHNIDRGGETEHAVKAVVGAEPPLEFVGEGANEVELSGRLFPYEFGGLTELDLLSQMRRSGKPQYLMRGDGKPFGWYAILRDRAGETYLSRHGIGKQIEVSVSLRRAPKPPDSSFYSLMQGLLP